MPEIEIERISVKFPFDPYPQQAKIMSTIIQSLESSQNALIESPTGTGKTLCLLCSALAWREQYMNRMPPTLPQQSSNHLTTEAKLNGPKTSTKRTGPQIFYASRTHSQLSQAVKELKRSGYTANVIVLGSRDQMCINDQVNAAPSAMKTSLCRRKVQSSSCTYYNQALNYSVQKQVMNTIMDIEDLVTYSSALKACPFYLARENLSSADVIFLPYNYLIDPVARKSQGVDVTNAIIIFDEGHNLESSCNESSSFEFTMTDLSQAIADCNHCLHSLGGVPRAKGREQKVSAQDIAKLQDTLKKLRTLVSNLLANKKGEYEPKVTKPGNSIYSLFASAGVDWDTCESYISIVEGTIELLSMSSTQSSSRRSSLTKIQDAFTIIFKNLRNRPEFIRYYRMHIQATKHVVPGIVKGGISLPQTVEEISLNFWCFSSGVAMQDLILPGVRSVILASGTLSPLDSFAWEMSIPFPKRLENTHVIHPSQIFVGIVGKGPSGKKLSSSFESRETSDYTTDLGQTVIRLANTVPDGMLVFFPSYVLMTKVIATWKRPMGRGSTIWEQILHHKHAVIEPKDKTEFNQAITEYESKLGTDSLPTDNSSKRPTKSLLSASSHDITNSKKNTGPSGAIFFSVCRGKASEGIDFSDKKGRAVLICGIPYPNAKDAKVELKKEILNDSRGAGGLNGYEWYRQQASRAVNQAIGRVIRHRQDWGAILLCDERFSQPSMLSQLPVWVRPHVSNYNKFDEMETKLSTFFRAMKDGSSPPPETKLPSFPCTSLPLQPLKESNQSSSFLGKESARLRTKPTSFIGTETHVQHFQPISAYRGIDTKRDMNSTNTKVPVNREVSTVPGSSSRSTRPSDPRPLNAALKADAKPMDAKSYLSLLRTSLTAKAFKSFQHNLKDYKSKQITYDQLLERIVSLFLSKEVDISADRVALFAGIRPFLGSSRQDIFEKQLERFAKKVAEMEGRADR